MINPNSFAEKWIDAWNCRDIAAAVGMFAADAAFTSPRAPEMTGNATLRGKQALMGYWQASSARIKYLRFTLDRVMSNGDGTVM